MQATHKTLTTLSVAVLMAIGGIAVAQTSPDSGPNVNDANTATSEMGAGPAPGTDASAASDTTTTTTDTSTMSNSSSTSLDASAPVAQVDRN